MGRDGWSPADYARSPDARRQPFLDLLALVQPVTAPRVLDVGCGTGALTLEAHRALGARETLGLDASPAMLAQATPADGVTLALGAVPEALPDGPFDVIVSNSALNWVPGHARVFAALLARLAPGGQLAVQMPWNAGTAFVEAAEVVARREPFCARLGGFVHRSPVEPPEAYVALLDELGVAAQRVGTWYYPQRHDDAAGLADFARGGLLSAYRARLSADDFEAFVAAYAAELRLALGEGPLTFPFRRLFVWARAAASR